MDPDDEQTRADDMDYIRQYLLNRPERFRGAVFPTEYIYEISRLLCQSNELARRQNPETYKERPRVETEWISLIEEMYIQSRNQTIHANPHIPIRDTVSLLDEILFDVSESWRVVDKRVVLTDGLEFV